MKKKNYRLGSVLSALMLVFFLMIIVFAGFLFFTYDLKTVKSQKSFELKTIADLKEKELIHWIDYNRAASLIVRSSEKISMYISNSNSIKSQYLLENRIKELMKIYQFKNICIFNKDFQFLYSADGKFINPNNSILKMISVSFLNDSIVYTDLYADAETGNSITGFVAPIKDDITNKVIGTALIQIDPNLNLLPLIKKNPVISNTFEVLLLRKEGNDALFLNDLRFQKDAALKLRIPLDNNRIAGILAISGIEDVVEAIDYRGRRVLADVRKIDGTDWYMVTKFDSEEIFAQTRKRAIYVSIIIFLFIVLATALFFINSRYNKNIKLIKGISDRKKMQILGEYLSSIIELTPLAVFDLNEEGIVKSLWNKSAEDMFGYKRDCVLGKKLPSVSEEMWDEEQSLIKKIIGGEILSGYETVRKRSDGKEINVSISSSFLDLNKENEYRIIFIEEDISERKEKEKQIYLKNLELNSTVNELETANEELQASEEELMATEEELRVQVEELEKNQKILKLTEERFNIAIKNSQITLFTQNIDFVYTWIYNPVGGLNPSDIIGKQDDEIMFEKDAKNVRGFKEEAMKTGNSQRFETVLNILGRKFYFDYTIEATYDSFNKIDGIICAAINITDKKLIEQDLYQAYKMEAIGQLAGGVAHDFNNMLAGIMGNAEILQLKLINEPVLLNYVDNIIRASEHSSHLTNQLLSFARKGQYQNVAVSVHRLISDVVSIMENTIDKRIIIEQKLLANPNIVVGDPSQIQNAILNLAINAKDAITKGTGKIVITTEVVNYDKNYIDLYKKTIAPGSYILISIADNGDGMSNETKKHLFEPFYTTKDIGKGTGLGLASVYGIVQNHNGMIEAYSEIGHGTNMKMYLPLSASYAVTEEPKTEINNEDKYSGNILIVDDEEIIRNIAKQILTSYGFTVILASDGKEALEIFEKEYSNIDLVILDMVMTNLNGKDTFIGMKNISANVKVILSSGYSAEGEAQEILKMGVAGFIQKPFRINDLIRKINEVLHKDK